jgi:phosphoglycolate phosphatase
MLKSRFRLLVFDWDGTLLDSMPRIVDCIQAAARDLGFAKPSVEACLDIVGLSLDNAIARLFPGCDDNAVLDLARAYRAHYQSDNHAPQQLFPHVKETLLTLRASGYLLAVATAKGRAGLQHGLESTGLNVDVFQTTRCADETASKPDPLMLMEIMRELEQASESTLMVGDTEYDLAMANRAGTASLAVSYGAHELERLMISEPLGYLDCFSELPGWLTSGQASRRKLASNDLLLSKAEYE